MEKRLKELREEKGLSRAELARMIGCHLTNLCDWEKGSTYPSLRFRTELAKVFGCEITDLQKEEPKNRIHKMRLARGLTQEELGKRLGSSQSEVCHWENEDYVPSLETLKKLAEALDCRWGELIEDSETVAHIAVPQGQNPIVYMRKLRGLSQRKLAIMADCGKSNISKWEKDQARPSIATLVKLAKFFECSIEDLV